MGLGLTNRKLPPKTGEYFVLSLGFLECQYDDVKKHFE